MMWSADFWFWSSVATLCLLVLSFALMLFGPLDLFFFSRAMTALLIVLFLGSVGGNIYVEESAQREEINCQDWKRR